MVLSVPLGIIVAACTLSGGGVEVGSCKIHKRERSSRCAVYKVSVVDLSIMVAVSEEKMTSHPASHNCGTESREYDAKEGTRCARRAARGNFVRGSSPSCVDFITVPFGFSIDRGADVMRQLVSGMAATTKLPVEPVSIMCGKLTVGGPVVCDCGSFLLLIVSFGFDVL